jgi:hypothetical protein
MSAQSSAEQDAVAAACAAANTVTIDPDSQPQVQPECLTVKGQAKTLYFQLTAAAAKRYRFAQTDPIVVSVCPDFPSPPVRLSDSRVQLLDTCTQNGTYEYTINLVNKQTGQPVVIDPQITNER